MPTRILIAAWKLQVIRFPTAMHYWKLMQYSFLISDNSPLSCILRALALEKDFTSSWSRLRGVYPLHGTLTTLIGKESYLLLCLYFLHVSMAWFRTSPFCFNLSSSDKPFSTPGEGTSSQRLIGSVTPVSSLERGAQQCSIGLNLLCPGA